MISIPLSAMQRVGHFWLRVVEVLSHPARRFTLFVLLLLTAAFVAYKIGIPTPGEARNVLEAAGWWAPVAGIGIIAGLVVMLFPRTGLAFLAGMVAPPAAAVVCCLAGTAIGATIAFGIGRFMGQPLIRRWLERNPYGRLARFEWWADNHGVAAMIYARVMPMFPCSLINYAVGATHVPYWVFMLGTIIGVVPSTTFYVMVGVTFSEPTSPSLLISLGVGAIVAMLGLVGVRNARRQLLQVSGLPNVKELIKR